MPAQFWRALSSAIGTAAVSVKADPRSAEFFSRRREALISAASAALSEGRIDTLRSLEDMLVGEAEWKDVTEHLRALSGSAGSETPETSLAWLSGQIRDRSHRRELSAADESQAARIDYVAAALMAAWDAMSDGPRGAEAYRAVQIMAESLFDLHMLGSAGDTTTYDELQHEVTRSAPSARPVKVKIVRPGVRWSDGIRNRIVIKATAEAV